MGTGRTAKAEGLLNNALKRDPTQRWATRALALILASKVGNPAYWRKAWEMVEKPPTTGDLPEDRLTRAMVLARGPSQTQKKDAVAILEQLRNDLPATLPMTATARALLADLLTTTNPGKAAELAAEDAGPGASPMP